MNDTRLHVRRYIAEGFSVIPVGPMSKVPTEPDWNNRDFTEDAFEADSNIGVRLGKPSKDLVDTDLDCNEAIAAAPALLLHTDRVHGRTSVGAAHYWFYADLKSEKFNDVDGSVIAEIRSTGGQTVLPGSIHPSGEPIVWLSDGEIARVDPEGLRRSVLHVATAALMAQHWPTGSRHYCARDFAGFLASRDVSAREIEEIVRVVATIAGDEEVKDRVTVARDTAQAFAAGDKTTGGPTLEASVGKDVVAILYKWFGGDEPADRTKDRLKRLERVKREIRRELDAEERQIVDPPPCLTLRERLDQPVVEIAWRIEGWLPADSRVICAAQFKTGKTTFVQNLIRSLVDGDLFLGRHRVSRIEQRVVLLDFEMSARQLDAWFRDQRIQRTDRVVPVPLRGAASSFDLRVPEVMQKWIDQLRALDCGFLIVDCLRPIMDALGLNEHAEAGLLLTALDALLKGAGIGEAVVVHHMGHNGERSRGDSRLRDWPDVEWRLVREDEDPASDRFITAFGRDVDVPESKLAYDATSRHLTIEGGSRREAKAEGALPAVLVVLRETGESMSAHRIERALSESDHSRDTIRKAIKFGVREGLLIKDLNGQGGGSRYAPSPERETPDF